MMIYKNKPFIFLVLLLIVASGITFIFKPGNVFSKNSNQKIIVDQSFSNIEISTNNAAVEIVPSKSSEATVKYSGKKVKTSNFKFKADVRGDTLSVQLKEKRRFFNWIGSSSFDIKLTVSVPEKQYESIRSNSDNGSVSAEDIQAKEVVLDTKNGSILVENVEATDVNVKTNNGRIILDDVQGKINGRSNNGRITLITKKLDQPIELATDNGRIEIKTESEPTNATIDAKSDIGKVIIFGNENTHVKYGKGEHLIKLRTAVGRIIVTK